MQRVYGAVEDSLLPRVDADAMQKNVSRAQWVGNAIASYLNHNGETNDVELDRLNIEINRLSIALDRKDLEITNLKNIITMKDGEINHLRFLTNDLRSLADNMVSKMLTGSTEKKEERRRWWWPFGGGSSTATQ